MCSIGEDDFGDGGGLHAMVPKTTSTLAIKNYESGECSKCHQPGVMYKLPFREPECKDCFLLYARHKFRAALGSSKILPRNSQVLLVFDRTSESIVLLDMLHHAQSQNNFKKLHCNVRVLYIDTFLMESNTTQDIAKYKIHLSQIQDLLSPYSDFESYIMPIEFKCTPLPFSSIDNYLSRVESAETGIFHKKFEKLKSLSSKQDFLKCHKSNLISIAAHALNCKFAMVPSISTTLASDLLSAIVLGRGGSAALDVALTDSRLTNDVTLIRPIKDLTRYEVDLYIHAQNLTTLTANEFGVILGTTASLQNLTKSFVQNLQENFPSTVSTIFRTGDKIAANMDISQNLYELNLDVSHNKNLSSNCILCKSNLDYTEPTTLLAIEISRVASETGDIINKFEELHGKASNLVKGSSNNYFRQLCHACRNILNDNCDTTLFSY